jgi:cytosine permease
MRLLTIALGLIGLIAAVAGVWTYFDSWLNLFGIFVPPIGAVVITDQVLLARGRRDRAETGFRPTAFAAWAVGSAVAATVHYAAPAYAEAVMGIRASGIAYFPLQLAATRRTEAA